MNTSIILGWLGLALLPLFIAVKTLRLLDRAAKERNREFKFMIVDLFSLIFLIQIPLTLASGSDIGDAQGRVIWPAAVVFIAVMVLLWQVTIRTIGRSGISTWGQRLLISIVVIPATYIGSYMGPFAVLSVAFQDERVAERPGFAWLAAACIVSIAISYLIVRKILSLKIMPPSSESSQAETAITDCFSD